MKTLLVEYEYIVLNLKKFKKKFKLPYLQKYMKLLENQTPSNIYKLRKQGYKVCMRDGIYYLIIKKRKLSMKSKKAIMQHILKTKIKDYGTLFKYLKHKFDKATLRTSNDMEYEEYSTILSILGTFWISNGNDLPVLTLKNLKRIKRYEVYHYLDEIEETNKTWFEMIKTTPERLAYFEDKHRMQTKRWKKSTTYKLNILIKNLKNYTSKWVYVNNTNVFQFLGCWYQIKDIDNYKVRNDNASDMDYVLCVKNFDTNDITFYDMNVDEIHHKNILDVTNK